MVKVKTKHKRYFDLVYEDFGERVKWNYGNDMLSRDELYNILNTMDNIKRRVITGVIPERRGVIELVLVYKEYYIM